VIAIASFLVFPAGDRDWERRRPGGSVVGKQKSWNSPGLGRRDAGAPSAAQAILFCGQKY